jgi:1,4-alpha-glucan branching enzyme
MAKFWIEEFHLDGFRIDEFKGIDSWDFIREFREHAWQVHQAAFPGRPFIVIAEDSWRRPYITQDLGRGPTVDAMWDFDFRDELRRLVAGRMNTRAGEPSRSARVRALVGGGRLWDDGRRSWRQRHGGAEVRFDDLAQRVTYNTSHDVEGHAEQRLVPFFFDTARYGWNRWNHADPFANLHVAALEQALHGVRVALTQAHTTFALMLTTVGIPMFLAGEEFGDLHDVPHHDWRLKMSDPVDWQRAELPGHRELLARVRELVHLRRGHPALHRNEVVLFGMPSGFHPAFDGTDGPRVFAYCRTAGRALGAPGQVVVVANCGAQGFASFRLDWPWGGMPLTESGGIAGQTVSAIAGARLDLALDPFQTRVFST